MMMPDMCTYCSISSLDLPGRTYASCLVYSVVLWFTLILVFKYSLKALLTYTSWMHEPRGKISLKTKLWLVSSYTFA